MTDFNSQNLAGSRFRDVDLTDAQFHMVDLSNTRFHEVDLTGASIRGSFLVNVDISGDVENLVVNGVDVVPLVEAELNRRYPDRSKMRPCGCGRVSRSVGRARAAVAADRRAGSRNGAGTASRAGRRRVVVHRSNTRRFQALEGQRIALRPLAGEKVVAALRLGLEAQAHGAASARPARRGTGRPDRRASAPARPPPRRASQPDLPLGPTGARPPAAVEGDLEPSRRAPSSQRSARPRR